MKVMKIFSVLLIGLISTIAFTYNINAKNISTLDVSKNNKEITVSGTTENGVLAIAVLVYSNDKLEHMQTCSCINNKYSCKLNKNFTADKYTVKVADYDGGKYIIKKIESNESNPLTLDGILLYTGVGILSVLGLTGICLYIKKKESN